VLLGIVALLAVLAIVLIPRNGKPDDGPLPVDLETRLLLGEDPDTDADTDADRASDHADSGSSPDATAE
ncbi:MAG: hypothetical protein JJE46_01075, partial [Acidimicrobiia bacterium]|nr:hypothetical protein [Acidimicrobiia bacterium]